MDNAPDKRSTSIEDVLSDYRKDPEYRKAERLISAYYELATQIINRRIELGLTQKELAERANTFQSRISKIESGEYDIRFSTLIDIAEALECEVSKNILIPIDDAQYDIANNNAVKIFSFAYAIESNVEHTNIEEYEYA